MYSQGASKRDAIWINVRFTLLAMMFIMIAIARIFNIMPDIHLIEWMVVGFSSGLVVWTIIESILHAKKIRDAGLYLLPLTVEGEGEGASGNGNTSIFKC